MTEGFATLQRKNIKAAQDKTLKEQLPWMKNLLLKSPAFKRMTNEETDFKGPTPCLTAYTKRTRRGQEENLGGFSVESDVCSDVNMSEAEPKKQSAHTSIRHTHKETQFIFTVMSQSSAAIDTMGRAHKDPGGGHQLCMLVITGQTGQTTALATTLHHKTTK